MRKYPFVYPAIMNRDAMVSLLEWLLEEDVWPPRVVLSRSYSTRQKWHTYALKNWQENHSTSHAHTTLSFRKESDIVELMLRCPSADLSESIPAPPCEPKRAR